MKDCKTLPPLPVETASGSIITLKDGRRLIDGISSWWCKSLGHGEPRVRKAFIDQLNKFEHVIMANCCSEPVAMLCEELSKLSPGLERVYLAENGSVSVEIAMKMSLQYHMQTGHPEKNLFAALQQRLSRRNDPDACRGELRAVFQTVPPSLSENTKARTALLYQRRRIAGMGAHARRSVEKDRGATRRTCGPDRGDCI